MDRYGISYTDYLRMGGNSYSNSKEGRGLFETAAQYAHAAIYNATKGRMGWGIDDPNHYVPYAVSELSFEIIELYAAYASRRGITGKSQSSDGVSESETCRSLAEREAEVDELILRYLENETLPDGTPLLYRGCSV